MGHTGRGHDDPYQLLGVDADASHRDIARAYRQAAQRAHPDAQPHDPAAAARFQALTDAYELLTDPGRRADYDRGHRAGAPRGPQPAEPGPVRRPDGSAYLFGPPWHQPVWAGPVLIEPPTAGPATAGPATAGPATAGPPAAGPVTGRHRSSPPAAAWSDPPVVLGVRADGVWAWVW